MITEARLEEGGRGASGQPGNERDDELARELIIPLIKVIESGRLPWRQPWSDLGLRPMNLFTGLEYGPVNSFLLEIAGGAGNHEFPCWLTRRQGEKLGWRLKEGARARSIFRPVFREHVPRVDRWTGEPVKDRWGNRMMGGSWTSSFVQVEVHNVEDFREKSAPVRTMEDMLSIVRRPRNAGLSEIERVKRARRCCDSWNRAECRATFENSSAYYNSARDSIGMPSFHHFDTPEDFYATWCHEIIHSTGHPFRLNRLRSETPDRDAYAYEELVAELGSYCLSRKLSITTELKGHASYLQHWLRILRARPIILLEVIKESQRAVSLVLRRFRQAWPREGGNFSNGPASRMQTA